jgi:hypothetical protein
MFFLFRHQARAPRKPFLNRHEQKIPVTSDLSLGSSLESSIEFSHLNRPLLDGYQLPTSPRRFAIIPPQERRDFL